MHVEVPTEFVPPLKMPSVVGGRLRLRLRKTLSTSHKEKRDKTTMDNSHESTPFSDGS